jgi:fructose-1,6-bisphosphatase/inositol monophosphatase family enzyme
VRTDVERAAIDGHRRSTEIEPPAGVGRDDRAVYLCLRLLLEAGQLVRARRGTADRSGLKIKDDGSPATEIEERIEAEIRTRLSCFGPDAVLIGEESGGVLAPGGTAVAIDPIDGTRAFLAKTETYSTTLALIRDGETVLGMVSNPSTGEIAYATAGGSARLIHLSLFGEPDAALALGAAPPAEPTLVHIHPSRNGADVVDTLYRAWERRDIAMVRSPGGSPSWGLIEAAGGRFVYANLWDDRPAEAFDLAAGVLVVRRAGGEVSHLDGTPIEALWHAGPFVAGLDRTKVALVADLLAEGLRARPPIDPLREPGE